jgi:hypothetical protein
VRRCLKAESARILREKEMGPLRGRRECMVSAWWIWCWRDKGAGWKWGRFGPVELERLQAVWR